MNILRRILRRLTRQDEIDSLQEENHEAKALLCEWLNMADDSDTPLPRKLSELYQRTDEFIKE